MAYGRRLPQGTFLTSKGSKSQNGTITCSNHASPNIISWLLNQICTQINLADVITVPFQSRILFPMGIDCKNRVKVEATVIQSVSTETILNYFSRTIYLFYSFVTVMSFLLLKERVLKGCWNNKAFKVKTSRTFF